MQLQTENRKGVVLQGRLELVAKKSLATSKGPWPWTVFLAKNTRQIENNIILTQNNMLYFRKLM
jgi:hypothetical protein